MAKGLTLYHNPRCSKSRSALELLRERGEDPEVVEYLKTPPELDTLRELVAMLGVRAHNIVRAKEPEYKEAGLSPDSGDEDVLKAVARYPKLLERPIAVRGKMAVIGRPPERVLDLL